MSGVSHTTIRASDEGLRLDRFLRNLYPNLPQSVIAKWCRKGEIRLDSKRVTPDVRVRKGQDLRLPPLPDFVTSEDRKKKEKPLSQKEKTVLNDLIIYQDNDLIVINKPAGLAVQGGTKTSKHIDRLLDSIPRIGGERAKIVHRLDKETSGLLLIARSRTVASKLMNMFKRRDIHKMYTAVIDGRLPKSSGIIDLPLGRGEKGNVQVDLRDGKPALTAYRVALTLADKGTRVELNPETGRMHQLRVHLAYHGCPIRGDRRYGGREATRMYLHATQLDFKHPVTNKDMSFTAPLPEGF